MSLADATLLLTCTCVVKPCTPHFSLPMLLRSTKSSSPCIDNDSQRPSKTSLTLKHGRKVSNSPGKGLGSPASSSTAEPPPPLYSRNRDRWDPRRILGGNLRRTLGGTQGPPRSCCAEEEAKNPRTTTTTTTTTTNYLYYCCICYSYYDCDFCYFFCLSTYILFTFFCSLSFHFSRFTSRQCKNTQKTGVPFTSFTYISWTLYIVPPTYCLH